MAQCERGGVGGVRRLRQPVSSSRACTIFWTCSLSARAVAGDRVLDLVRRVLHDLAPGGRRLAQRETARLTDAHRRAHVDLEEHLLDGDDMGLVLLQEVDELGAQRRQPLRQRIGRQACG